MITIKGFVIGLLSGLIFGGGWLVFIDAQINSPDAFPGIHILPPLGVTLAAIMTNLVSPAKVLEIRAVKAWIFVWFTVFCICVGCSIWILVTEYPAGTPIDPYPGVGILVQNIAVMTSTVLFFIGRRPLLGDSYSL